MITTDAPAFGCTWHINEPWLARGHMAFNVYRLRKDGAPDRRAHSHTVTFPIERVLANPFAPDLFAEKLDVVVGGRRKTTNYARYVRARVGQEGLEAIRDVYQIARDWLMDINP